LGSFTIFPDKKIGKTPVVKMCKIMMMENTMIPNGKKAWEEVRASLLRRAGDVQTNARNVQ